MKKKQLGTLNTLSCMYKINQILSNFFLGNKGRNDRYGGGGGRRDDRRNRGNRDRRRDSRGYNDRRSGGGGGGGGMFH